MFAIFRWWTGGVLWNKWSIVFKCKKKKRRGYIQLNPNDLVLLYNENSEVDS